MTISVPMLWLINWLRYLRVNLCILGRSPALHGVWVALFRHMTLLPGTRLIIEWVIARLLKLELKTLTGLAALSML